MSDKREQHYVVEAMGATGYGIEGKVDVYALARNNSYRNKTPLVVSANKGELETLAATLDAQMEAEIINAKRNGASAAVRELSNEIVDRVVPPERTDTHAE